MKKNQNKFIQANFNLNKSEKDKANQIFVNYLNGTKKQIEKDRQKFSTMAFVQRLIQKNLNDPTNLHILEIVKRMEKDKLSAPLAFYISEECQKQSSNFQKSILIKMIPFFIAILGLAVSSVLLAFSKPYSFANSDFLKYLVLDFIFLPILFWGLRHRQSAKFDMINLNVLLQASSAYASAKAQGKTTIAAMQNLDIMRRKAKSIEKNQK